MTNINSYCKDISENNSNKITIHFFYGSWFINKKKYKYFNKNLFEFKFAFIIYVKCM